MWPSGGGRSQLSAGATGRDAATRKPVCHQKGLSPQNSAPPPPPGNGGCGQASQTRMAGAPRPGWGGHARPSLAHTCVGSTLQRGVAPRLGARRSSRRVHAQTPETTRPRHATCFFRRRGCGQPQASGGQAAPGAPEPSNRAGLGSAWRSAPAHHCRAGPRWASRATRGSTHPPAHVVSASTSRSTRAREHVPSAFGQDGASGGRGTPQCTRQSKGHGSRCGHQHPAGGVSDAGSAGKPAGLGNLATWMCAGPTTPG